MKDQLVDQYLSTVDCHDGIFLVAWFDVNPWDAEDYRKNKVPKWTIEEAREFFRVQARSLSNSDRLVSSFVLDCNF